MKNRGVLQMLRVIWIANPPRNAVVVVLLVLAGLSEGLGIVTLLPLLSLTVNSAGEAPSGLARHVSELLSSIGLTPSIVPLLVLIVVLMVLKGGLVLIAMKELGYAAAHLVSDLRLQLIRAMMRSRWQYVVSRPLGAFVNAVTAESQLTSYAYTRTFSMVSDAIQVAVYASVAILVSWKVTVGALAVGGLSAVALRGLVRIATRAGMNRSRLMKSISSRLADGMQGIKPLKSMACEDLLEPFLEKDTMGIQKAEQDYVFSRDSLQATSEAIMTIALVVGLYLALTLWHSELEVLIVFGLLFWRTVSRIAMLQRAYQDASTFQNHFWSLCDTIEQAEGAKEPHEGEKRPSLDHGVAFRNLTFSYTDSPLLTDVSLMVPAGGFTAITGPSGSGKTTLADLITGLLRPQDGEVWIDEVPMAQIDLGAWRRTIGYVPQETLLFHESIFVNVTLRDPDLTRDDAIMALKSAEAWDFVRQLPEGLDTVAGERGAMLSGGQRQRIAIARALARKPRLLILDEVTTGLDPKTEAEVCATLKGLRGRVTILAISHQPALVQSADTIYRLEDGKVSRWSPHLAHLSYSS